MTPPNPLFLAIAVSAALNVKPVRAADQFERISKEDDFVAAIVGKRLIYENGVQVVFVEDRTFDGIFSGSKVWGEWVWRDDRICHQFNVGEKRYKVDCRIPEVSGKKIRFRREDGSIYGTAKIEK